MIISAILGLLAGAFLAYCWLSYRRNRGRPCYPNPGQQRTEPCNPLHISSARIRGATPLPHNAARENIGDSIILLLGGSCPSGQDFCGLSGVLML